MNAAFDSKKSLDNLTKHGIGFDRVSEFDWASAITRQDTRVEYGEPRFISLGYLGDRLYVLVWTIRQASVRPISFRKANAKERKFYEAS